MRTLHHSVTSHSCTRSAHSRSHTHTHAVGDVAMKFLSKSNMDYGTLKKIFKLADVDQVRGERGNRQKERESA